MMSYDTCKFYFSSWKKIQIISEYLGGKWWAWKEFGSNLCHKVNTRNDVSKQVESSVAKQSIRFVVFLKSPGSTMSLIHN